MRVISGSAKRLQLKTVPGNETRPTTDRIKETLFNMISMELTRCRFLDLFAGSGAIGIEALSRGAKQVIFIENNRLAIQCIKDNLKHTHLEDGAMVIQSDVQSALSKMKEEPFDFIFMDPPYHTGVEESILRLLKESTLLHENTIIIIEAAIEETFSYLSELGFTLIKNKEYKTNKHLFIKQTEE